jgi:hypothetical protein
MSKMQSARIFLISPANLAGSRGRLLTDAHATSELAVRLRNEGVPLGELFSFVSSLYFRGKLTYSTAFSNVGSFVITGCGGLLPPGTRVSLRQLQELTSVDFDPLDSRYLDPLHRDCKSLVASSPDREVVLLGSIATPKYVEPLLEIFGDRLLFPLDFIGRGDMSRGGLLLRSVESGVELTYAPVSTAQRHGSKPPKLLPRRPQPGG